MAKKVSKPTPKKKRSFTLSKSNALILGATILALGIAVFFSILSFYFNWKADQSILTDFANRNAEAKNILSKFGAAIGHALVYKGFGIAALFLAGIIARFGWFVMTPKPRKSMVSFTIWSLVFMLWISLTLGFFGNKSPLLGGVVGFEMNDFLQDYVGKTGIVLLLTLGLLTIAVQVFNFHPQMIIDYIKSKKAGVAADFKDMEDDLTTHSVLDEETSVEDTTYTHKEKIPTLQDEKVEEVSVVEEVLSPKVPKKETVAASDDFEITVPEEETIEDEIGMEVEPAVEEDEVAKNLSDKLVSEFGEFDPTLELGNYKFPTIELLDQHGVTGGITINQEELEDNKNRIVETLKNYNIGIAQIKATIGPTVTLYEIVPDAGVRISKIKNLEDDIALSLAALGIRIIAPIPGKGTIGIEVPNKNATMVSMRSVIASTKFQKAEMELPIAFGKTISNETFVVDLAKMPHMLMAGATGQGKSVGLNAVLTSLLYKKHPAEVKFVLVDPKKVELTLFNKIERHYLAKLPDSEDAIITDNAKVINTLNSLCIEMDNRYELLKNAMVRNIKEYNVKFKARKLNPNDGHKFLPYIVLVVDEFADLIMTAGKEVETPIARLAQLARAIGIHLIIATQRPSVNVITGIIKANFPARIAFRVTSKIDSRTILDAQGADQLIGRGDMLYTQGNDVTRIQCAFVDTPEVEKITAFIGSQRAYPDAYLLPEYVGEESGTSIDNNISDRDALFRDAAEVVIIAQQGSASLIQRKLKLGYNRAGRIIDQLEAAGIVGPFEGSKARQVLVQDMMALDHLLDNELK